MSGEVLAATIDRVRVAVLVGGEPGSIMDVRARGLLSRTPSNIHAEVIAHEPHTPHLVDALRISRRLVALSPDVVYVLNTGTIGLPAELLHLMYRTPFIIDTGDLAHRLVTLMQEGTVARRWWIGATERLLLAQAHSIVVRGSHHQSILRSRYPKSIVHIPDGVDVLARSAPDASRERARLSLGEKITVGFVGHLGWSPVHQWGYGRELIDLLSVSPDLPLHGIVIGDGPGRPRLEAMARQLGIADRLTFTGYIPYSQLPPTLALLDIALLTMVDDESWEVRTTGKLPEYLASGRYILATQIGEPKRYLPGSQILEYHGIYDPDYGRRLARKIREMRSALPFVTQQARRYGPMVAQKHFDYAALSARWSSVVLAAATSHR